MMKSPCKLSRGGVRQSVQPDLAAAPWLWMQAVVSTLNRPSLLTRIPCRRCTAATPCHVGTHAQELDVGQMRSRKRIRSAVMVWCDATPPRSVCWCRGTARVYRGPDSRSHHTHTHTAVASRRSAIAQRSSLRWTTLNDSTRAHIQVHTRPHTSTSTSARTIVSRMVL